jgi:Na+-driven multidrug efflux pump
MPYFSIAFLFISVNIVLVGYLQSTEKTRQATLFTLLRGFVFSIPCFVLLPLVAVPVGIWLALPLAEALTTTVILIQHRSSFFHA